MVVVRAAQKFAEQVDKLDEFEILPGLQIVARYVGLNVFGAWYIPHQTPLTIRKAYLVHIHPSVSDAFLPEFWQLHAKHGRSFMAAKAWQNRGAFTMTEALRELKPTGDDRWLQQLCYRHHMRDLFYVPNGRWMVVYWSPKPLLRLDTPSRVALQLAAGAAAARLRRVIKQKDGQMPDPGLSSRQRAVLRLLAQGQTLHEAADHLAIGYETAREHCERAAKKLGARNLHHAVAEALRRSVVLSMSVSMACGAIFEAYDICCWDDIVRWSL